MASSSGARAAVVAIERRANGVRIVRLSRPSKLNALNMAMFRSIRDAALEVAGDKSARAVVLCGAGRAFCAGLDVRSVALEAGVDELLRYDESIGCNLAQAVSYLWRRVPCPVVAAVQGACLGGGFQIALGADLRLASPDARFSVMEAKWGLIPDMGLTVSALPSAVPRDRAKELTFTGRVLSANEALGMGLVTRVVDDDPQAAAIDMAESLAEGQSPDALRAAKRLIDATYDDARMLSLETKLQRRLLYGWNQLAKSARSLKLWSPGFLNPSPADWSHEADDKLDAQLDALLRGDSDD